MFKKLIKIGGQNQLSGKDRKMLKADLAKQLGEEEVEHFFATHEKLICEKVSGTKTLIYVTDDYPVFVDGTGKGEFFPSLYALSAYPTLLPNLTISQGVETFIIGGANLMWPGVQDYSRLGDFKKDDLVAIKSSKGEFVAVAALAVNKKELTEEAKKGTACYVLHYLNDKLWEHGSKVAPKVEFQRQLKEEVKEQPKKQEEPQKKDPKPEEAKKKEEPEAKEVKGEVEKPKPAEKKDKKKKGESKQEEPAEQPKETKKAEPVKPAEPVKAVAAEPEKESSEDEGLETLLHNKKAAPQKQPAKKVVEDKPENKFSDDSDDDKKKKKKKPAKGKAARKESSEEEEEVKKPAAKKKGKKQESDEEQQEQAKKPAAKKKGKKQESDDEVEEVQEKKPKKGKKKDEDEEAEPEQKSALAPHIMDDQFKEALLNALKLAVDDSELPMDSGMFYTEYIVPARREGVTLDIKQSSYKKMNKFYETMDKLGFIEFKQGKQKNGAVGSVIAKVHHDNEVLSDHVPTIKKLAAKGDESKEEKFEAEKDPKLKFKLSSSLQVKEVYRLLMVSHGKQHDKKHEKGHEKEAEETKQTTVEENPLEFLFPRKPKAEVDKKQKGKDRKNLYDPEEYFTEDQVKTKLNAFINQLEEQNTKKGEVEEEEVAKPKKDKKDQKPDEEDKKKQKPLYINYSQNVAVQKLLKDEIDEHEYFLKFEAEKAQKAELAEEEGEQKQEKREKAKKKKDRGEKEKDKHLLKITKEELEHKAMQFLQPFHQIIDKQNDLIEFRPGKFTGIHVGAEKSNNKNITTLSDFEIFIVPKDKVAQQTANFISLLQQKFNSNVSAHNLQRKAGGKELSIQGHFLDEVVAMLVDDFKIRKEYITTTNKLDKKKKN